MLKSLISLFGRMFLYTVIKPSRCFIINTPGDLSVAFFAAIIYPSLIAIIGVLSEANISRPV